MIFFLDTANIDEIREAAKLGVVRGVTTNPSLIAKSCRKVKDVVLEIASIVDGPISAEINPTFTTCEEMFAEAKEIATWHENMVVKIPFCVEGLKCCHLCHKAGIKTNVTLIFTANQALLAAQAGADFVSPFIGRLEDIGHDAMPMIQDILEIISDTNTRVICASVRNSRHINECAKAMADIATVPYSLLMSMIDHPLTTKGIEKFQQDFLASQK